MDEIPLVSPTLSTQDDNRRKMMPDKSDRYESQETNDGDNAPLAIREILDEKDKDKLGEVEDLRDDTNLNRKNNPNNDDDNTKRKERKRYHYNWAQSVGKQRESWIDPFAESKQTDLQDQE